MRFNQLILCILVFLACASCSKTTPNNDNTTMTVNGRIEPNTSPYTYGTNLLVTSSFSAYLVESTSLTLASFVGDSVQATLKDMNIRQNPGMELYNVIALTPVH
jgi:hypothetical protein